MFYVVLEFKDGIFGYVLQDNFQLEDEIKILKIYL